MSQSDKEVISIALYTIETINANIKEIISIIKKLSESSKYEYIFEYFEKQKFEKDEKLNNSKYNGIVVELTEDGIVGINVNKFKPILHYNNIYCEKTLTELVKTFMEQCESNKNSTYY